MKISLIIILISLLSISLYSQVKINGKMIELIGKLQIAYVNVGIKGTNIGTASYKNGTFEITVPVTYKNQALTFSAIGYETIKKTYY